MLIGEYYHNLDAKGRVSIPSKFRDDLGGTFVLSKGLESCLRGYSVAEWEGFQNELLALKGEEGRMIQRFFFGGATECEIDAQGRVVIPPKFREYAQLSKEIVIVGMTGCAEIWAKENWDVYTEKSDFEADKLREIAEKLGI